MEPAKYVWGEESFDTKEQCEEAIAASLAQDLTDANIGLVGQSDALTNNTAKLYAIEISVSLVEAK